MYHQTLHRRISQTLLQTVLVVILAGFSVVAVSQKGMGAQIPDHSRVLLGSRPLPDTLVESSTHSVYAQADLEKNVTVFPLNSPPQKDAVQKTRPLIQKTLTRRSKKKLPNVGTLELIPLLTQSGPRLGKGVVWRFFLDKTDGQNNEILLKVVRAPNPRVTLNPATYLINVAFGRANLTRKVVVQAGEKKVETFVLNAGGLRLKTPSPKVVYTIFKDFPSQSGNRPPVASGVKPGIIVRLNSGIYHVVSRYGDANAIISKDVTVEAGKLTEITVKHAAGFVTFGLVTRPGGEAFPGTRWVIKTKQGKIIKRSVGALPTHTLAPGAYLVDAKLGGRTYSKEFIVRNGKQLNVEVQVLP